MEENNPYKIIQNLYTVIGKMSVKLDAYETLNQQSKAHIEALKTKLKELNDARSRSDEESR